MRFLIVDGSRDYRKALAAMLGAHWPQAEVAQWDPRAQGDPRQALADGPYDAVLLDCGQASATGIDELQLLTDLGRNPHAPPILLLDEEGGEYLAVKAMKAGAADFLAKRGLSGERLIRSVEDALRERKAKRLEASGTKTWMMRTQPIDLAKIGSPVRSAEQVVRGYRVLRMIGQGGMARVYLAERERDGLQLVLKVLDHEMLKDEIFVKRFLREYRLLAGLQNEYVVQIFEQGFAGEHPYIAMEYLPGGTLAARIQSGFTSLVALRVISQLAQALDAIHSHGIVHRDLKPANILFRENGRPAIVDFGLSRAGGSGEATLTRAGELIATPRYMSPEQCIGQQADARSDLYAIGVIFYEMLTGHKLFESEGPAGLLYMHVHGEVPPLPAKLSGYQTILDRLLAKKPEDRFQSARELFATIAI